MEPTQVVNTPEAAAPSSPDVKPGVNATVPLVDEKGVSYYNRYREVEDKLNKYKDVDVDKWSKLKDLDPDRYAKATELEDLLYNTEKGRKILEQLQAEDSEDDSKSGEPAPEIKKVMGELGRVKEMVMAEKRQKWMEEYDRSLTGHIDKLAKETYKDLGELTPFEKKAINHYVDNIFQHDASSPRPKLSLADVPKYVEEVMKEVVSHRSAVRGNSIKKDVAPTMTNSPEQGVPRPAGEADAPKRIQGMVDFLRTARSSQT